MQHEGEGAKLKAARHDMDTRTAALVVMATFSPAQLMLTDEAADTADSASACRRSRRWWRRTIATV